MGKLNQPLNIKTAAEQPILKLGLPKFRWSFYFILLTLILFIRIFMTLHMPLSQMIVSRLNIASGGRAK